MAVKTLPLDPVVDVVVNLSVRSAARKAFNVALLVGETTVISQEDRVKSYSSTTEMLSAGFLETDRLYKAAALIFGQSKKPPKVMIGKIGSISDGGTSRTETPLETFTACRAANGEWYIGVYCGTATNDQHLAVAEYFQTATPESLYAYTTSDADVLTTSSTSIFATMKSKNYSRSIGQYSTKHPDAICAIVGWAMGAMTGTLNSAFTLAYKTEIGVETENASSAFPTNQLDNVKSNNGNIFINRGTYYDIFEEGTMANGTWFDEMIFLDKYKNDMQLSIMDLLYTSNKVSQTEAGMTQLIDAINSVCMTMNQVGFVRAGRWNANDVLKLKRGDVLPNGYYIQSGSINDQAQADREARKAPPIYISLKLAGAIQHVTIQADVNR